MHASIFSIIGFVAVLSGLTGQQEFGSPLDHAWRRETLLTFGLHVTPDPEQNPIDPPERFSGYHTALDYEILPDEADKEVPVYAVCDGEVIMASTAEGYGGVIVHRCELDGEDVTVLYGHIDPASFAVGVGDEVEQGQHIAVLAPHKSAGSGDTRKHLHLGIHRGQEVEMLGYVETQAALADFIDPATVLP